MSVLWIVPAALIGVALVGVPLAIHLLVRQHVRSVPFPSLRFLQQTPLAAFKRRRIEDPLLLAIRMTIVAVAALALAGPIVQTPSRTAAQSQRVSRAIVVLPGADAAATLGSDAFRSARFQRSRIADAIGDAVRWQDAQPASSREIVLTGALRRGQIVDADLAAVPDQVGVRFVASGREEATAGTVSILTMRGGALVRIDREVAYSPDGTRVTDGQPIAVKSDLVRISGADQTLADAALRVALSEGAPWRDFEAGVELRLPDNTPPAEAADVVLRALRRASPPMQQEPVAISQAQLDAWTRAPGAPSPAAPLHDEGDRRWLWSIVLGLLAVEWWVRRRNASAAQIVVEASRVA